MFIGMGESDAAFAKVAIPVPVSGTIGGLQVRTNVVPGASPNSYTFTVYVNGAATAATCVIGTGATSCSDSVHTVAISMGDAVSLQQVGFSTPTAASVTWSYYINM
ncbi:hypothetical protein [Dokdonella sp.]|uniref:hypothetical protein n=1 Tax=Dokdonella sp. TaxID=2291710 RepID=UPI002BC20823|nr:hypothetical protein [Dokdonella sp.]HOX70466.1 hypothetical protein [Dokdonella sp.]